MRVSGFNNIYYNFNKVPAPCGWRASCHEMSKSRRLVKLKGMKKEIFHFMPLSCGVRHRQTSILQGLHIAVATHSDSILTGQKLIPQATPHIFPITYPHHTILSCIIFLACLTSKPLFFKQAFTVSIHLFLSLPIDPHNNAVILHSFHMAEPLENTFINPFVHALSHSYKLFLYSI